MKKIAVLVGIGMFGWFINLPDDMPQARLDRYDNKRLVEEGASVGGACQEDKCLIVYVAPWCPSCKSLTPTINALARDLEADNINVTVVVGKDSMDKVLSYGENYDITILNDANGQFYKAAAINGVPYFAVTNHQGKRLNEMSGGYRDVSTMRDKLGI